MLSPVELLVERPEGLVALSSIRAMQLKKTRRRMSTYSVNSIVTQGTSAEIGQIRTCWWSLDLAARAPAAVQ